MGTGEGTCNYAEWGGKQLCTSPKRIEVEEDRISFTVGCFFLWEVLPNQLFYDPITAGWGPGPHHFHEEHTDVKVGVLLDVLDDAGLHELASALHQQAGRGDAGQLVALEVPQPPGQDLKGEGNKQQRLSQRSASRSLTELLSHGGKPESWPTMKER